MNRFLIAVGAAALAAGAVMLFVTRKSATPAQAPPVASAAPTSAPIPSLQPKWKTVRPNLSPEQRPQPQPLPPPTPAVSPHGLPTKLAGARMAPEAERALQQMDPQQREMIDFKLGLLARVDACVGDRVKSTGTIDIWTHFKVQPDGKQGIGSSVEFSESALTEDEDRIVLDCLKQAHVGATLPMHEGDGVPNEEYHGATSITFPVTDDRIYQFLNTGK